MSWNYSGNPADSKKDEYRFLLGDTDMSAPIMQDEEIQYIIDTYGDNPDQVAYELFNRAATLFARDIKRSLGPQSEDPSGRLAYFREQASSYKAKLMSSGLSIPKYAHPKVFRRGMQNNPPWPSPKGGGYSV